MSKNKGCALDSESAYTRISVYYAWFLNVAGQQPPSSGNTVTNPVNTDPTNPIITTEEPIPTTEEVITEAPPI